MAQEIERKFLVDTDKLPPLPQPLVIKQGYIPAQGATVRVRISNDHAFLTLKGRARGLTRSEFEYPIPVTDAEAMLEELCIQPYIDKKRYLIEYKGHTWELDIFEGENAGLIVAEIELSSETEPFEKPEWVTQEVSDDPHYRNAYLVKNPYKNW
jgi:adenylate cyclase